MGAFFFEGKLKASKTNNEKTISEGYSHQSWKSPMQIYFYFFAVCNGRC